MEVNGKLRDLSYNILEDSNVKIITSKDQEGLEVLRHDAAHIMAMAVQEIFPEHKLQLDQLLKMVFTMILHEKSHLRVKI